MSKFKPSRTPFPARKAARATRPAPAGESTLTGAEKVITTQEPAEDVPNVIQHIGFYAVMLFVFLRFSFLHEFIAARVGANLHLIVLLGALSYLCCILSGRITRGLGERSAWLWLGFAVSMAIATATSFWKGGSFPLFFDYLQTALPVIVVIPALVVTPSQIANAVNVIGIAAMTTVVLGTVNDDFRAGRMGVNIASSEIQNPNDYAAHLILMLPALAFWAFRRGTPPAYKLIGVGGMALCLRQILSSGSRGALISLAATALYVLFVGEKRVKAAILIGVPAMALAAIPFVPATSLTRLATLFSTSTAIRHAEAEESSEARLALLKESWKLTLENPLTGVGPGEFMDYQAQRAGEVGQRGMWHVTHNSYTQVSSECGIPAFLLYVGALTLTFSNLRKVTKSGHAQLVPIAATLLVMLVAYGICIFFLSLAYTVHLLVISALAASMKLYLASTGSRESPPLESLKTTPEPVPA